MRWYAVHTLSGSEEKAMKALQQRIEMYELDDRFGKVLVPSEVVVDPNLGIIPASVDDAAKIHLQLGVLRETERLRELGCPLLYYAARKPERLARIMMASAVVISMCVLWIFRGCHRAGSDRCAASGLARTHAVFLSGTC